MSLPAYHWLLSDLLLPWVDNAVPDTAVTGINLDSRLVAPGDIYLAVAGATTHGMNFALDAVDCGATAVLLSDAVQAQFSDTIAALKTRKIPVVAVSALDDLSADIASRFYAAPDTTMQIVAVTGTDGKTSVCRFIAQALMASSVPCGYIGTLGWGMGEQLHKTALTTPDRVAIRRMLACMRDQGAQCVALEASSHGLAEGRLDGLSLDVAVLTNFARDHLDYHVTVEAYRAAKERLFHWDSLQAVVLNADDAMGQSLISKGHGVTCFSYSAGALAAGQADHHVLADNIVADDAGLAFNLIDEAGSHRVVTSLLGGFNVDNLLASYASLRACDVAANEACHGISCVLPVAGRMDRLGGGDKPTVVVDYSHTPGALQAAIDAVRIHCAKELWVVFGCGGDRDTGKRVPMAKAAQTVDHVVLTDDNPRTESSESIIEQVLAGFDDSQSVKVIPDRAAAIRHALTTAGPGDLVLIAGKGHEDYQIIGTQKHHFSDLEQARTVLGVAL